MGSDEWADTGARVIWTAGIPEILQFDMPRPRGMSRFLMKARLLPLIGLATIFGVIYIGVVLRQSPQTSSPRSTMSVAVSQSPVPSAVDTRKETALPQRIKQLGADSYTRVRRKVRGWL